MKIYRITTSGQGAEFTGAEFEVEDDATEEAIAEAAADAVAEHLSYGWELVEDDVEVAK